MTRVICQNQVLMHNANVIKEQTFILYFNYSERNEIENMILRYLHLLDLDADRHF